jgi:hypothetical protein
MRLFQTYSKQPYTLVEVNKVSYWFREILSAAKWYPEAIVSLDNIILALLLLKVSLTRPNLLSFSNFSRAIFLTWININIPDSREFYSQTLEIYRFNAREDIQSRANQGKGGNSPKTY